MNTVSTKTLTQALRSIRSAVLLIVAFAGVATIFAAANRMPQNDTKSTAGPGDKSQGAEAKPREPALSGTMLIEPDEVAKAIQSSKGDKPLVIHVGFHILYTQAHIPGSEYLGPASKDEGMAALRKGLSDVPKNKEIILYCGCCPWTHCPNVKPAYEAVHAMGFTNVKVMHVDDNLGTNWVNQGYPTAKGE